jgi:hypothetical protein
MSEEKQLCPCCTSNVQPNPRYTAYVCRDCVALAKAPDGRAVIFNNVNPSDALPNMSVAGSYVISDEVYASDLCTIRGLECQAREARFGGVVIQPIEGRQHKGSIRP